MMTNKFFLPASLLRTALLLCFAGCLVSCSLPDQNPNINKGVTATATTIYLTATGSSLIDLNARIKSDVPVHTQITTFTTNGKLTTLGNGLLQYDPTVINKASQDSFGFNVLNDKNEILKSLTIALSIESDTTHLPCGIFTNYDFANITGSQPVTVDVIANDIICGLDSTQYDLTIFSSDSIPSHGTAVVLNNRSIEYTPASSLTGFDRVIYKIQSHLDPAVSAYGYLIISKEDSTTTCDFTLYNAIYNIDPDHLDTSKENSDSVILTNFSRLSAEVYNPTCLFSSNSNYSFQLITEPSYGKVIGTKRTSTGNWEIDYAPNSIPHNSEQMDSLGYKMCLNSTCHTATISILIKRN